jgi:pyruvate/2-oxoglutarate dehydrogenase complex dihydrolipoamide acyltransferase (E2) component
VVACAATLEREQEADMRGRDHRYAVHRVPDERVPTIELMPALALHNSMHALVEVDVTEARRRLEAHRERTGESRSFTAFVITCLARAVDEQRGVQGFRRGRRILVSDTVDVANLVEVDADGEAVPLPQVIRDAANRTYEEIHAEIRGAQRGGELVRDVRRRARWLRRLPRPVRWVVWRALARATGLRTSMGGTVVVTSVGSVGRGRGWGLAGTLAYPVSLTVGGIHRQPALVDGVLVEREWLCLTVSLDHEVTDGAPAARFVRRLGDLLEQAYGLEELEAQLRVR